MEARTLYEQDTVLHADCVESCPIDQFQDIMVCGTYHLTSADEGTRAGNLHVIQTKEAATDDVSIACIQQMDIATGIFDMKWSSDTLDKPTLALATADGTLEAYQLSESKELEFLTRSEPTEENIARNAMYLSLDWNNRVQSTVQDTAIVVSQSDGGLSIHQYTPDSIRSVEEWQGHHLFHEMIEVWIAAFNPYDTNVIFSGGDDALLKGWDRRMIGTPTFTNRQHDMGVCSVQFHPHLEHIVATGSYDERIRLWDARQMKKPMQQFEAGNGGGVWRLKWHPYVKHSSLLLTACMRNGFQIVQVDNLNTSTTEDEQRDIEMNRALMYDRQESLAYGVDWSYDTSLSEANRAIVGSCSFYDHSFNVWKTNLHCL